MSKYIVTFKGSPRFSLQQVIGSENGGEGYELFESKEQMEDFISENDDLRRVRVYKIEKEFKLSNENIKLKEIK